MRTLTLLTNGLLGIALHATAFAGALLPAADGDLVAPRATLAKSAPTVLPNAEVERAPVQFAWALDAAVPLRAQLPHVAESRGFHTELDATTLAAGHAIDLDAPGAVLRISPLGDAKTAIAATAVELLKDGRVLGADAIEHAATAAQLKAAGMEAGEGTLAFRIAPAAGSGRFVLRAPDAQGRYLLHVHEPASLHTATLATAADTAFAGGRLTAMLELRGEGIAPVGKATRGALVAPDGRVIDVRFDRGNDGSSIAEFAVPESIGNTPGLWELHAFAVGEVDGRSVLRDVKTSFAVALPTARLGSDVRVARDGDALRMNVSVQVGAPGRYELRGVLYGTAADGVLQPLAAAHSARWLDADGAVELSVPAALIDASGLRAPYELRALSLLDQARLARLESRGRALVVAADAVPTTPRQRHR